MHVRRTPYINSDRKPLGAARKQFSSPPLPFIKNPVSLEFNGGCTVLSINPSNSILSAKALQAFKYAFLRNQKIGIGCLPSNESPSQIEIDKATAAYEIARELVDWSEQFCVDGDTMHDMDTNTEGEHRSCDLKKEDGVFSIGKNFSADAKDLSTSGEVKLSLEFSGDQLKHLAHSVPDGKLLKPILEPFLDSVLLAPSPCEGMDFFGSPSLDDLCEMKFNGQFDRVDVDVSYGTIEDTATAFIHDGDSWEDNLDNLASPLSSPGSPSSPYSPDEILPFV